MGLRQVMMVGVWVALATPVAAEAGNVAARSPLAGSWEGIIMIRPAEYELELSLEVEQASEGSLRGQISYPTQDVIDYPLQSASADGEKVSFVVKDEQGLLSNFQGWLSEGGEAVNGDLAEQGAHYIFEMHRRKRDAARTQPAPAVLQTVSGDIHELRSLFDQDQGRVRMLLILSPTCPMCRNGARLVQRYVLDRIADPSLRVYVVWEAEAPADTLEKARAASTFIADPRVRQLWSPDRAVGKAFQQAVGVKDSPAWDVFLLFAGDKSWQSVPPAPDSFMHNLMSHQEMPRDRRLNGTRLNEETAGLLAKLQRH